MQWRRGWTADAQSVGSCCHRLMPRIITCSLLYYHRGHLIVLVFRSSRMWLCLIRDLEIETGGGGKKKRERERERASVITEATATTDVLSNISCRCRSRLGTQGNNKHTAEQAC